jgi:D-aspartate ligase
MLGLALRVEMRIDMTVNADTAVVCGGLDLLRCFAGTGITVTVAGWNDRELALHSRYCRRWVRIADPATDPGGTLEDMLALGRMMPWRPTLFFDNEPMLLFVSRHRQVLQHHYRFLLPEPGLVEDTTSKVRFADLAQRLDLPVPRTLTSGQAGTSREAADALALPCIFKPISHVGWYDTEIVRAAGAKPFKALLASTPEQFHQLWEQMSRHNSDFVIQEYIPGADNCIYSFHAWYDRESRLLGSFVGRKIRTYPKVSGISTYLELTGDPDVDRLGREILAKMNFVGAVKLDLKRDPVHNRLYLLEVNSRFNLWHRLGAACGINLPAIAHADLHEQACPRPAQCRTGVRWLAFDFDLRAMIRDYHPDGDLSWPGWLWSLRGRKVYSIFSWGDPIPFAVSVVRYAGRYRKYWRQIAAHLRRKLWGPAPPPPAAAAGQGDLPPPPAAPAPTDPAARADSAAAPVTPP